MEKATINEIFFELRFLKICEPILPQPTKLTPSVPVRFNKQVTEHTKNTEQILNIWKHAKL